MKRHLLPLLRGTLLGVLGVLGVGGCSQDDGSSQQETDTAGSDADGDFAKSTRLSLQWKRNLAFEIDLRRALELTAEELCTEFGQSTCTRKVHHIALGGSDPLTIGLYEPLEDTLASTPVVVDRVVLSGCTNRATMDLDGEPVVFTTLDLQADAPEPGSEPFEATITTLYRRLLARDPEPEELELLAKLTRDSKGELVSGFDFAVLACFTIGTTTEFLFF